MGVQHFLAGSQLDAQTSLSNQLKVELSRQNELHAVQARAWSDQYEVCDKAAGVPVVVSRPAVQVTVITY